MTDTLDFTKPHVLRTEGEYDQAIKEINEVLDADPPEGSEEYDRLVFLSVLVEAYEEDHYPLGDTSTPQSVVLFMLEQKGLKRSDLTDVMGGRSRVSEFFSQRRPLSRGQIERLRDFLGIPADLLLG